MKIIFWKRLLLIAPIVLLIIMLGFIDYTVKYFEDTTYQFFYETNVGGVERFSREMDDLIAKGYVGGSYSNFYADMIKSFTKTHGNKYAVIAFLIDENAKIYYDTDTVQYVTALQQDPNNVSLLKQIAASRKTGKIQMTNAGKPQEWFYQQVSDGKLDYYICMSVDKDLIVEKLNTNKIVIPIGIIGLVLILSIEVAIWSMLYCKDEKKQVS